MAYEGPDFTGLPEEIESVYRAAYPQPIQQPTYQPVARDHRLGPLRVNGGALDSATLAVLQAMQNQPMPRSGAGGFVAGVAQGFAGARGRQIGQRQKQYERDEQRAADEAEERRRFRSQAGASLAKARWDMYRDAKEAASKPKPKEERRYQLTPNLRKQLKANRIFVPEEAVDVPESAVLRDLPRDQQASPYVQFAEASARRNSINSLVDNVRQDPDVRDFITVRDQRRVGKSAAASGTSAGDIILMRAVARASDPQTGVREEEFRTFQGAQGALDALGVRLGPELVGMGRLNEKGRQFLKDQLENIYQNKKGSHLRAVKYYRDMASDLGLNPDRVVRDFVGPEEDDEFDAVRKKNRK